MKRCLPILWALLLFGTSGCDWPGLVPGFVKRMFGAGGRPSESRVTTQPAREPQPSAPATPPDLPGKTAADLQRLAATPGDLTAGRLPGGGVFDGTGEHGDVSLTPPAVVADQTAAKAAEAYRRINAAPVVVQPLDDVRVPAPAAPDPLLGLPLDRVAARIREAIASVGDIPSVLRRARDGSLHAITYCLHGVRSVLASAGLLPDGSYGGEAKDFIVSWNENLHGVQKNYDRLQLPGQPGHRPAALFPFQAGDILVYAPRTDRGTGAALSCAGFNPTAGHAELVVDGRDVPVPAPKCADDSCRHGMFVHHFQTQVRSKRVLEIAQQQRCLTVFRLKPALRAQVASR